MRGHPFRPTRGSFRGRQRGMRPTVRSGRGNRPADRSRSMVRRDTPRASGKSSRRESKPTTYRLGDGRGLGPRGIMDRIGGRTGLGGAHFATPWPSASGRGLRNLNVQPSRASLAFASAARSTSRRSRASHSSPNHAIGESFGTSGLSSVGRASGHHPRASRGGGHRHHCDGHDLPGGWGVRGAWGVAETP